MSLSFNIQQGFFPWFTPTLINSSRVEKSDVAVKIYSIFYKQMSLEWTIPSYWGSCTFNVYKSPDGNSGFTKINETPIVGNYFKDTTTVDYSKFRESYYRLEVKLPSGNYVTSPVVTWENKRNTFAEIRAREVTRRESILLNKFVGIKSLLFRRRTFGKRCSNCWNVNAEKVMLDHCPVCLGTSFEGGYFPGVELLAQYEPTSNQTVFAPQGTLEPNNIPAWTVSNPVINTLDIILRVPDWKLYRIEVVQTTELQAVTVRQLMNLTELDKESIEYQLALQAIPVGYQT